MRWKYSVSLCQQQRSFSVRWCFRPARKPPRSAAGSMHAELKNATPIVTQAACRGYGPYCGPGWVTRGCGYWGCRCVPCSEGAFLVTPG